MASFSLRTTTQGLQLLASTLNNQTVNFTTVVLGSGVSGSGTDTVGLVMPVLELPIISLTKSKNKVVLTAVLQYGDVETGFTWSEVGLYAADPNGGEDILVYYSSTDKPDYIPGKNETTLNNKMLQFKVSVVNADNVTISVEGNTIFATAQQLESLRSEITETFEQISEGGGEYGNTVVTLTHEKTGTVHAFTGLGDRTGLVPCQFKSAAGYTEGDTATIDGVNYTITLTGADAPETDLFVSGKSILVDVDTESKTINFKAGGGLTKGKLALADATEDVVFAGRTFYAGDKKLRTGAALATPTTVDTSKMFTGVTAYNQQGQLVTGAPTATTATAANLFNGKTAYDNNGNLITGTALATASTATAADIVSGKKAYNSAGNLITGTLSAYKVITGVSSITSAGKTTTISAPGTIVAVVAAVLTSTILDGIPTSLCCYQKEFGSGTQSNDFARVNVSGSTVTFKNIASSGNRFFHYWICYTP